MNTRISQESSKLIQMLNPDIRYIKFFKNADSKLYSAVICSQITDEELSLVLTLKRLFVRFAGSIKIYRFIRGL